MNRAMLLNLLINLAKNTEVDDTDILKLNKRIEQSEKDGAPKPIDLYKVYKEVPNE